MRALTANGITLHVREDGDPTGLPVVFSNSLGTDLRLWDPLIPHLPAGLRLIRYDTRGHGLSDAPDGPYTLDQLTADAEALIDSLDCGPVVFVGLSIGGMTGQLLAHRRPDLIRALALVCTAPTMGNAEVWRTRIDTVARDGMAPIVAPVLERWFAPAFTDRALWAAMLARTPATGYIGACHAIAATDLSATTPQITAPTLVVGGAQDAACPAEAVRAMAATIAGATCHILDNTGHLPSVEKPAELGALLTDFIKDTAHD